MLIAINYCTYNTERYCFNRKEIQMDQCLTKTEDWQLVRKDGQIYHLPFGMSFVGREECDITLQSHSADKRHAVLFYDSSDKEVRIKDLNSITGTHVNSVRIPEQSYVKLNHLDCIRFGYDLFYIQKLPLNSLIVSPGKEIPGTSAVCNNNKNKVTDIELNTKGILESTSPLIEQENNKESDLNSSIHEADSLEDIKQSISEKSSNPTLVICEKICSSDKSHSNIMYPEDKENIYLEMENSSNQNSQKIEILDVKKECESLIEEKQKTLQHLKREELIPVETEIFQLCNGKNHGESEKNSIKENEKANDNSESSPVAMAFTIAFDDFTASRKKLGIKDSISQYAPRKTEPERSPIQKLRPGKLNESNPKKVLSLDVKDVTLSTPDISKKWIQENTKEFEPSLLSHSSESTLWDIASKSENKEKVSSEGKLSEAATFLIQKMLNGEQKMYNSSSSIGNIELNPRMSNWPQNWNNKNQLDGIIKSPTKTSVECKLKSPDNGPISQKEIDDKSETGTYTVETDLNDPVVDEARQKIDEIFGIHKNIDKLQSSNINNLKGKEKQCAYANEQKSSKPVNPVTLSNQQGNDTSCSEKSHLKVKSDKNIQRQKRRLPTPPVPKQFDVTISDSSVDSTNNISAHLGHYSLSLIKKEKKQQTSHNSNQDISCELYPKQSSLHVTTINNLSIDNSADRRSKFLDNVHSQKVQKSLGLLSLSTVAPTSHVSVDSFDSQTWNNITQQDGLNEDDDSLDDTTLSQYVPSDTRSEGSPQAKTPQSNSGLWRRIPWNLSNSDLELNRSKSETASVVSDLSTSTEPSSLSSQYSKGKSDTAPPMRLNRAFALRRARLGIESDSATTIINKKDSKENIKQHSSSTKNNSHLNPSQLSRQDGGRFSLRLPRKCTTKSNEKTGSKCKENKRNSATSNKNGHRRIESDPGKTNIHWKKMDIINDTVSSDLEVSKIPICSPSSRLQSFHRSASFNGAEELLCAKDNNITDNSLQKKIGRPNKLVKTSTISKLRKQSGLETARALGISPGWQHSSLEEKGSDKLSQGKGSPQQQSLNKKELSALDSLVISAIHQLSIKLRTGARCLLEKERQKHAEKSDIRLMIEEILPQVVEKKSSSHNEGNLTRDLSSILKNLKRVEQSLEVLSSLADYDSQTRGEQNQIETQKFFVVNV